ncbi:serine/threonine-protein kinase PLK4 [Anoplophora glabripennis]|uniref:serine/threonine-protein kinase PLK4 n=1 Tax=Anoplophora glabripennis TaxID=217634 RepID=UPI0008752574|nr:serine/threonine-protein kinase PLK4 [Anoplophora glabripennis]
MTSFGERIEDYEVHNLLGKGGFASVYRARCLKTGIEVAIKMIDKKLMQATGMVSRVKQEVSIHSRLKHPSILELFICFEDINYVYLVLELCHNGELQKYVKEKTLSESEVSSIMRQVVEGIRYLHSHNILHRDLSLSNLLLTKDMQVKIADFGLATQLTRPDEKHMTMCGTPNFISPEVASRGSHGLEADVWGLGCLLYTLLVGSPPFDTPGVKSTLTKVVMSSYSLPSYLSPEAKDLINSLLQKNPKDRMKLEQVLEHPFIKRGRVITSHLTHDSGIHTMSSRRESAFSDSALPFSHNLYSSPCGRRTNSDCGPSDNLFQSGRLTHSMEQLRIQRYDALSRHTDLRTCSDSCSNRNEMSLFSNGESNFEQPMYNKYSCQDLPPSASQCSQRYCSPIEPGGVGIMNHVILSLPPTNSHHSDAHPYYSEATSNYTNNYVPSSYPQEVLNHKPILNSIENCPRPPEPFSCQPNRIEKPKNQGLVQLCSKRLLPTRHQTKNAILSILEDGEVCIEFIKKRGQLKREMVCEVMKISSDGLRIILYEPEGGKGVPPSDKPPILPSQGADKIFSIENLPEKHWKKYMYAFKFVDLVRAKTPKVTYYTDKAKCLLMENLIDFETCFYDGAKITQSSTEGITIIDASGNKYNFQTEHECRNLTGTLDLLWSHSQDSLNYCKLLEKTLSELPRTSFPVIVGRRPVLAGSSGKENRPQSAIPSFTVSIDSSAPGTSFGNSSNVREKRVAIPGVGIAFQLPNGEVQVRYQDGSQLWVDGKHHIRYQYPEGHTVNYTDTESIPHPVMEKLHHMPRVLKHLMPSVVTQKIHNLR